MLSLFVFVAVFSVCESSSHWIVTENGKINAQIDSPFALHQSHNLIALVKQEQRIVQLHKLRHSLFHYKYQFVELTEMLPLFKSSEIEPPANCNIEAKDVDTSGFVSGSTVIPLEDKGISHHDYLDPAPPSPQPICSDFSSLPFNMYSMNHLTSVRNKHLLNGSSEVFLLLPFYLQLNEFGNSIYQGLQRNRTSWVLYNLAAIYWRAGGQPSQAIDCIQRAFYYSPSHYHDIPLLHLANVLLYSNQLNDALIPLKAALYFSSSKGPLYYTLANIYEELGYVSEAINAVDTALYYGYDKKKALLLRNKYYCQLKEQHIVHNNMDKVIDVKHQLLKFYEVLSEVHRHTELNSDNTFNNWMSLLAETGPTRFSPDKTVTTTVDCNQTHSNYIELLLSCSIQDISIIETSNINQNSSPPLLAVERELQRLKNNGSKPKIHLVHRGNCQTGKMKNREKVMSLFYPHPKCPSNHTITNSSKIAKKPKKPSRYTEAYRQMEFLPYSSLPPSLEEEIFPNKISTADYNDPYWPTKVMCLELVEGLDDNLPRFTGTFLTPESRGVKFKDLLTELPSSWQREPLCSNVSSLPYSMLSMDHLLGVANRHELSDGEDVSEKPLQQLLISTVEKSTGTEYTLNGAGQRIAASLYKYTENWALYNLASVYWRSIGNGLQSVECLRRAIHFAGYESRDIGLIGLANVLHRHGYLDSAMVVARAALDIRTDSPIGHYTVAGVYLTGGNLPSTNLHLRMALNLQPHFSYAYSALKLVRCSLKFKEEQKLLEQKQQLLQAQQELIRSRREPTAANLQEILQEIVRKQAASKPPVNLAEDESIKYLTQLAATIKVPSVNSNKKTETSSSVQIKPFQTKRPLPSSSPSHSPVNSVKPKYTMELMAKENEREEELRKQWPDNLPWPTLEECRRKPPPQFMVFTSTWLSVTAKKINISDYMEFNTSIDGYSLLPICEIDFDLSSITLDYLEGMNEPPLLDYIAERGLEEVLCKLSGSYTPMEEMATRMKLAMMKNTSNWVVSNLAALYWRIVGDGQHSLKCLKHALHYAPPHNRDVGYVSVANVLYRSGYYENAATTMQLALETSPNLVVNHFTMANILAAQSYYQEAAGYYELVLYHQPEFGPASERLRASRCMIILGKNKIKLKDLHEKNDA